MSNVLETYEVEAGNVLYTGSVFFKVEEVREPHNPICPGLVFEGHYFDNRRQVWAPKTTLSAQYGRKWRLPEIEFPELHFSAYLKSGDLAIAENVDNGAWCWSHKVKCKVLLFDGSPTSWVKITGKATQFVTGKVYEIPSQRLYRRKASK
ncbi:hypothetical protein [Streptomyces sp. NPDC014622]|uniref:hypothetical protein n=1 Tax=Streptomyces sp. NPDC014622 TaxID=3364874 RepID=UPI0036F6AD14